jgi:hypothetical protein
MSSEKTIIDRTAPSNFGDQGNSYVIKDHRYPIDLTTSDLYSGNKVLFFINVAAGSKSTADAQKTYKLYDIPKSDYAATSGRKLSETAGASTALSGGALKRLSVAIALYVPNSLTNQQSVDWSEEDFSQNSASTVLDIANNAKSSAQLNASEGSNWFTKGLRGGWGAVTGTVGGAASAGAASNIRSSTLTQHSSRVNPGNSKAEQLFRSVGFRDLEFSYQFAPRSEEEALIVFNIIRAFKHHMLPEYKDDSKFLFIYPSEFNIKYFVKDKENEYLDKNLTAVLTAVNVDYTPNGQFITFKNGMPQQINMSLRFKELSLNTKESMPFITYSKGS